MSVRMAEMKITDEYQAELEFVAPEDGGMGSPPRDHLACIVRFEGYAPNWTLLLDFNYIGGLERRANITYLVDEAPFESLQVGAEFDLLNGSNIVAQGKVTRAPKYPGEEERLEEIAEYVEDCAKWMISHLSRSGLSNRTNLESVRSEHKNMRDLLEHLDRDEL